MTNQKTKFNFRVESLTKRPQSDKISSGAFGERVKSSKEIKFLKKIKSKDLAGQRVIVRADFNVPIVGGKVAESFRLESTLPTLKYLSGKRAKVMVISHLGDKKGSLLPVVRELEKHMVVGFAKNIAQAEAMMKNLKEGGIFVLENLRNFPGEEKNDKKFAEKLASLGDIYINDAFSASHRNHASIVGLPKLLPSFAGLLFESEWKNLSKVLSPKKPFAVILGGAKFSTKLPLLKKLLKKADFVFVGGALAHNFYREMGFEIGRSLVDKNIKGLKPLLKSDKLNLPTDVIVLSPTGRNTKRPGEIKKNENILDLGPESVASIAEGVKKAKTILWNGPLGNFEKGFSLGTTEVAKVVARSSGLSVVGGGDTVSAIKGAKLTGKFGFVSTAGGAMIEFLTKGDLSGIKALKR